MKKTTHTKQEHIHVKNLKRQLIPKDFLRRLKYKWVTGTNGLWSQKPDLVSYLNGEVDEDSG